MIIYSNPYNSQKNIGKAYNDFIRCLKVPDDTWICLQDGDIIFLTPNWGRHVQYVVECHGNNYQLFGCMTNRVGVSHHLLFNNFSNIYDINNHREVAEIVENKCWNEIHEINDTIAGFFMLFQLKTWKAVGGFDEGTLIADILFSEKIINAGGKTALIKGLYVYHDYRPGINVRTLAQASYHHLNP